MRAVSLVVVLLLTGCGLGVGAVNGPSRIYQNYVLTGLVRDSGGQYSDGSGGRWRMTGAWAPGTTQPLLGALLGTRRGWAWSKWGDDSVEGGDVLDVFFSGYYKAFSIGVGYTTETGTVEATYTSSTKLHGEIGYHGWYVEPGLILLGTGPFSLYATMPIIKGEAYITLQGNSHQDEAPATGVRPGLRFSLSAFELGPIALQITADLRYLISEEAMPYYGGDVTPSSYHGWSSGFAFNFIL
jgi:hypothetical protein